MKPELIPSPPLEGEDLSRPTSYNILRIEDVSMDYNSGYGYKTVLICEVVINALVTFNCRVNGNTMMQIQFQAQGRSVDQMEAIRQAVQSLLDGNYGGTMHFYDVDSVSMPDKKKIHKFEYEHLGHPWIDLFDSIFKNQFNIDFVGIP